MGIRTEPSARRTATLKRVSGQRKKETSGQPLSKESFCRELNYQITASLVRTSYRRRIIQRSDLLRFLGQLVRRYRPLFGWLAYKVEKERGE